MKRTCPVCDDEYPIFKFMRDVSDEDVDAFTDSDWRQAKVVGQELEIGGLTFELSTFCAECGRMLSRARKNMDERLGHGAIKTRRASDGKYVDMEPYQEYMYMVNEAEPEVDWEFANEDEVDSKGRDVSFNDIDLARLSYWRIKRVLNDKGFNEVPWHEVEDHAQNVSLMFLEKLVCDNCGKLCAFGRNEDCGDYQPHGEITYLHSYHWACCKAEAKKIMMEWVERRKAEIPQDVLDIAEAQDMTDEQLVRYWRTGAVDYIDRHNREAPLWMSLQVGDLAVKFGEVGVDLSARDIKMLRNAVLAEAGESKDGKNKAKVKKIVDKIGDRSPKVYAILKDALLNG